MEMLTKKNKPQPTIDTDLSKTRLNFQTYQSIIYNHYLKTKEKNPNYSMRSFAKNLDLSPSFISMLFNKKRQLDVRTAEVVAEKLNMTADDKEHFLSLVEYQTAKGELQKTNLFKKIQNAVPNDTVEKLTPYNIKLDALIKISKWYYNAILAFLTLHNENKSTKNISKRLGLEMYEAEEALERLKRLNLVHKVSGQWQSSNEYFEVKSAPSAAVRNYQKTILEKAMIAVDEQKFEERDISSLVFTLDPNKLPLARQMISDFQDQLATTLGGPSAREVYQCSIQLFKSTIKD